MEKTDVLIIGGGPAGIVAALTAKKFYPSKEIIVLRASEKSLIPCAIPYIFKRLEGVEKDLIFDEIFSKNGITLKLGEAVKIDPDNKKVLLKDGNGIEYQKLILALGSLPIKIPIEGIEKEGVFFIKKDFKYLKQLREEMLKAKKVVIVGGGFIGLEVAEEIVKLDNLEKVTIVERSNHCLAANFDEEFAKLAEEKLKELGVELITEKSVARIEGEKRVERVSLDSGESLEADLVLIAAGAKANISLAEEAGLKIDEGRIWVDEYQRTSVADVFAVGDCSQTKDFFTRKTTPIMLASTACAEARIAGANLYELKLFKENRGTIAAFSTSLGDLFLGAAGLTEKRAREEGFEIIVGEAESFNRHPASIKSSSKIKVKLIFAKNSGILIGAEIAGSPESSELINLLSLAIQKQVDVFELSFLQISTHPLLSAPPTAYPIIAASQDAILKMRD